MSYILPYLKGFAQHLEVTRQVGHTTAMLEGAKNVETIVVTHNAQMGSLINNPSFLTNSPDGKPMILKRKRKGDKIKTFSMHGDLNSLRGIRAPIAFDNAALYELFRGGAQEIERLEAENLMLKRKLTEIKFIIG